MKRYVHALLLLLLLPLDTALSREAMVVAADKVDTGTR